VAVLVRTQRQRQRQRHREQVRASAATTTLIMICTQAIAQARQVIQPESRAIMTTAERLAAPMVLVTQGSAAVALLVAAPDKAAAAERPQAVLGIQDLKSRPQANPMMANPMMARPAMNQMGYAMGGYVEGPGTGRSDSIPAKIYQDGVPVQEAALSDGEFGMTERAVKGAGDGDRRAGAARMYEMMKRFERGGRA